MVLFVARPHGIPVAFRFLVVSRVNGAVLYFPMVRRFQGGVSAQLGNRRGAQFRLADRARQLASRLHALELSIVTGPCLPRVFRVVRVRPRRISRSTEGRRNVYPLLCHVYQVSFRRTRSFRTFAGCPTKRIVRVARVRAKLRNIRHHLVHDRLGIMGVLLAANGFLSYASNEERVAYVPRNHLDSNVRRRRVPFLCHVPVVVVVGDLSTCHDGDQRERIASVHLDRYFRYHDRLVLFRPSARRARYLRVRFDHRVAYAFGLHGLFFHLVVPRVRGSFSGQGEERLYSQLRPWRVRRLRTVLYPVEQGVVRHAFLYRRLLCMLLRFDR